MSDKKMPSQKSKPPADGERSALIGYVPQYQIAASLVYSRLVEGNLEWIRIADPTVGRTDDILIGTVNRVDAYQVKWGEYSETISFNDLKTDKGEKPNLVSQLADGWQRLRMQYPDRRVVVHLITRHQASSSTSAKISTGQPPPQPKHFQAFILQCWNSLKENKNRPVDLRQVSTSWKPAIDELKSVSGLSDTEFSYFVSDCELEFEYKLPSSDETSQRDQSLKFDDIHKLFGMLLAIAGKDKRTVELKKAELLKLLKWEKRFEFRHRHEFPIDERLYEPVQQTVDALENLLNQKSKGYIAVIGTPGSGKSTLLTKTLRYRKNCRIIRYYAFVRDDTSLQRGKSVNFFHDIVLAIEREGFITDHRLMPESSDHLLEILGKQFIQLHDNWIKTGIKTLILIDGLDHIEREQKPDRSLLTDLPLPNSILEGILFVLGTQKTELTDLSERIKSHLKNENRTIEMRPLSCQATLNILNRTNLNNTLSQKQKEKIFELSEGHPLYLIYLIESLINIESDDIESVLSASDYYGGDIEEHYSVYWSKLEDDDDIRYLFAIMCRLRGSININQIAEWKGEPTVRRLIKTAGHYFRKEPGNRWYFFHNSFKQFLLKETSKGLTGSFEINKDRSFHKELAEYAAKTSANENFGWEELFHRAKSDDDEKVLSMATQKYFRQQFFRFRHLDDMREDIHAAMRIAGKKRDAVALLRLILIDAELSQRVYHINRLEFVKLLVRLGQKDTAIEHVRKGENLRIDKKDALEFSRILAKENYLEEGQRIFNLAEPLEILRIGVPKNRNYNDIQEELEAWVRASVHFRHPEHIIKIINELRKIPDTIRNISESELNLKLQAGLLFILGIEFIKNNDTQSLIIVRKSLENIDKFGKYYSIKLDIHKCNYDVKNNNFENTEKILGKILLMAEKAELSDEDKTLIAEFIYRIKGDAISAKSWLQGVKQPPVQIDLTISRGDINPFLQRFRLNRLLSALGDRTPVTEIVKETEDDRDYPIVIFERAVCKIAQVWGSAWRGERLSKDQVIRRELMPGLRMFNQSFKDTTNRITWISIKVIRKEFYGIMIDAAKQNGGDVLSALAKAFEQEWNNSTTGIWQSDLKRSITLSLNQAGESKENTIKRLEQIEKTVSYSDDVESRNTECFLQTNAWLDVGETERARQTLNRLNDISFGIASDKEEHFIWWMEWLRRINMFDPAGTRNRLSRIAKSLVRLKGTIGGSKLDEASREYLKCAFLWSPVRAVGLYEWLFENEVIRFIDAVEILIETFLDSDLTDINSIIAFAQNLLIPFTKKENKELAAKFVKAAWKIGGSEKLQHTVSTLISALDTRTYFSNRLAWKRAFIEAIDKIGIDSSWIIPDTDEEEITDSNQSDYSSFHMADGNKISCDELCNRIKTYDDLKYYIDIQDKSHSFYRWDEPLKKIINTLNREEVIFLLNDFFSNDTNIRILNILVKHLNDLGHRDEAKTWAEKMLEISKPYGWVYYSDGGSRLMAFERLVEIDPEYGREKAFNYLVNDITSELKSSFGLLAFLDRILPLISAENKVLDYWKEIEEHITQLYELGGNIEDPTALDSKVENDSFEAALVEFCALLLTYPIEAVHAGSHRVLVTILTQKNFDRSIYSVIDRLLNGKDIEQRRILMVLDSVRYYRTDILNSFKQNIARLCVSPDYSIRKVAIELAAIIIIGVEPYPVSNERKTLPIVYTLHIPPVPMQDYIIPFESISPGDPLPDSEDSFELVRPLNDWFKELSGITDIPYQNLCYRASRLMHTLESVENWNANAEKKLREKFESADLKISFHRPRTTLARQAFSYIVAELADAHILDEDSIKNLNPYLTYHDPKMSMQQPQVRPEYISKSGIKRFSENEKNFLNTTEDALQTLEAKTDDGRLIVGEMTRSYEQDWKKSQEYRFSMVCGVGMPIFENIEEANQFFILNTNTGGGDYPNILIDKTIPTCILYSSSIFLEIGDPKWLALNPFIGQIMGWRYDSEGLFRWTDDKGNIMVESIWWADGPLLHDVLSEGWLVLASPEAVRDIEKAFGKLKRISRVIRKYHKESIHEPIVKSAVIEQSVWEYIGQKGVLWEK